MRMQSLGIAGALALMAMAGAAQAQAPAPAQQAPAIARPGSGVSPRTPINTLKELYQTFAGCFKLPPREQSRSGMEITVRFSITKTGELLGEPHFTFSTPDVSGEVRGVYQRAVADAFTRCTPFPLTPSFSEAVAGRPQTIRFTDPRGQRKA